MKIILTILFIFNFFPLPGGYISLSKNFLFEAKKIEFYHRVYSQEFSEELLKECIYYEKIEQSDIVLKQARLETGYYTSELFFVANNVFGMKFPHHRETTAILEYNKHSKYLHWTDSVKDYKKWQEWYKSIGYKFDEYLVFLQYIGYAEDPLYVVKLSSKLI